VYLFLILSVVCTAFLQCHHNCVCAFVTLTQEDYFLVYLRHFFGKLRDVTKVLSTRKPAFIILLICAKKLDTTNRISIAIVDEAMVMQTGSSKS